MIDINRLHAVIEDNPSARQSGRTTAMLVTAAQLSDFNRPLVIIVGPTQHHAKHLFWQFLSIADDLEYDARMIRERQAQIGNTIFKFESIESNLVGISDDTDIFVDHFAEE